MESNIKSLTLNRMSSLYIELQAATQKSYFRFFRYLWLTSRGQWLICSTMWVTLIIIKGPVNRAEI